MEMPSNSSTLRLDDRVELALQATFEHKAAELHDNVDRESRQSKVADVLLIWGCFFFLPQYPSQPSQRQEVRKNKCYTKHFFVFLFT